MTPTKNPDHEQARRALEQQVRDYQAKGGTVTKLKTGASGIDHRSVQEYAINQSRRSRR
jgi:hypothetical protein